jgi:hypothetical protein
MKSSFAKTFEMISKGDKPIEERYNRISEHAVEPDGTAISREMIYVLKAEIDISTDRCLMANRRAGSITLEKADGVKNYFIGKLKDKVATNDVILCATIPFTRNLIEYTKGEQDADYRKLTSLLHWKEDTDQITVGGYLCIYNGLFGTSHNTNSTQPVKELLFTKATEICDQSAHDGLNLEDKILLSIAIRLQAEIFIIKKIRALKNDANYWCQSNKQFGNLMKEFASLAPAAQVMRTLEKVSITVSSNIHLNSFMYEPILDLTIDHLINLYKEVCGLTEGVTGAAS